MADKIDFGTSAPSKKEMEAYEESHQIERIKREAEEAKREHTIPMKIKRFVGRESEKAKAVREGFEAGKTEEQVEKTPEFYPEKEKAYYAPTKGLSKRLFGFAREAKKDITKAGEVGKEIGKDIGQISKEAKEVESFLGGPSKGTKEGGFFSASGTMFEKSAGISRGGGGIPTHESFFGGGGFMSAQGTMFEKAGSVPTAGIARPRKSRKYHKKRKHKKSSGYILVRMPRKTASQLFNKKLHQKGGLKP